MSTKFAFGKYGSGSLTIKNWEPRAFRLASWFCFGKDDSFERLDLVHYWFFIFIILFCCCFNNVKTSIFIPVLKQFHSFICYSRSFTAAPQLRYRKIAVIGFLYEVVWLAILLVFNSRNSTFSENTKWYKTEKSRQIANGMKTNLLL